jgi:uncharacterized protein YkwD
MRPRHLTFIVVLSAFAFGAHSAPVSAQSAANSNQQVSQQSTTDSGWQKFTKPGSDAGSHAPANSKAPVNSQIETSSHALMDRINEDRISRGLSKLEWNDQLAASALTHGRRLVEQGRLSHQLPGEPDLSERIHTTGLRFDAAGENLAIAGNVEQIHTELMNSPPHRENILDPDYNSVGIAIISRGRDLYAVENFARMYPDFSEPEFRNELISAFNQERKARKNLPIAVHVDSHLVEAACSGTSDAQGVLRNEFGARTLVIFTSSSPDMMPQDMLDAAADPNLARMNLGVCYRPGKTEGNASFRIVAALFPVTHN